MSISISTRVQAWLCWDVGASDDDNLLVSLTPKRSPLQPPPAKALKRQQTLPLLIGVGSRSHSHSPADWAAEGGGGDTSGRAGSSAPGVAVSFRQQQSAGAGASGTKGAKEGAAGSKRAAMSATAEPRGKKRQGKLPAAA